MVLLPTPTHPAPLKVATTHRPQSQLFRCPCCARFSSIFLDYPHFTLASDRDSQHSSSCFTTPVRGGGGGQGDGSFPSWAASLVPPPPRAQPQPQLQPRSLTTDRSSGGSLARIRPNRGVKLAEAGEDPSAGVDNAGLQAPAEKRGGLAPVPGRSKFPSDGFSGVPGGDYPRGTGAGSEEGEGGGAPLPVTDPESFLRGNLSLKDLVSLAYMFNFTEAGLLDLGERKAVVQVRCHALLYMI